MDLCEVFNLAIDFFFFFEHNYGLFSRYWSRRGTNVEDLTFHFLMPLFQASSLRSGKFSDGELAVEEREISERERGDVVSANTKRIA